MTARFEPKSVERDLIAAIRRAARQEQFLEVVSAEEARARFARHIDLSPLPPAVVNLSESLGRVLAHDVTAPSMCRRSIAPTSMASRCAPPTPRVRATSRRAVFRSTAK
jgi:hypothetical protein